ncbi:unnamed protein product [Amoebophrya sp. A120]|nr:unnamed protein product [Amoebophrya sp. A120]|eukprot:GSA120T00003762001.1
MAPLRRSNSPICSVSSASAAALVDIAKHDEEETTTTTNLAVFDPTRLRHQADAESRQCPPPTAFPLSYATAVRLGRVALKNQDREGRSKHIAIGQAEHDIYQPSSRPAPSLTRLIAYYLVHSWRCFGYVPAFLYAAKTQPFKVLLTTAILQAVRANNPRVSFLVHLFCSYGSSREPRFVNAARKKLYDKNSAKPSQYLATLHPHGILCCGWFNLISRLALDWSATDRLEIMDGLPVFLCFAPMIQHLPLHGDMYMQNCGDASGKTVRRVLQTTRKTPAIAPGGFSESAYCGWDMEKYEVAYLLQRTGFVKIALEQKVDLLPVYTFGNDNMYLTWDLFGTRQLRAEWSQKIGLPLLWWNGADPFGCTNLPKTEDLVTVVFDPFVTEKYWKRLEEVFIRGDTTATKATKGEIKGVQPGMGATTQSKSKKSKTKTGTVTKTAYEKALQAAVEECHRDYLQYLWRCFEEYKHVTPASAKKALVFAGRGQKPIVPDVDWLRKEQQAHRNVSEEQHRRHLEERRREATTRTGSRSGKKTRPTSPSRSPNKRPRPPTSSPQDESNSVAAISVLGAAGPVGSTSSRDQAFPIAVRISSTSTCSSDRAEEFFTHPHSIVRSLSKY